MVRNSQYIKKAKSIEILGSGAITGKMLLVRIVENNKILTLLLGQVRLSKC